jgi:dipeptidyl aminopeptidase/acylaminoacyl peptidase
MRGFGDTTAVPLLASARSEWSPHVSPDGRWLAYTSNATGRVEVYVSPLADPASARVIVSSGGGNAPRWSADGRALFFLSSTSQLMEARLATSGALRVGNVRPLFDARGLLQQAVSRRNYDVAPDGRFLFVRRADDTPAGTMVVVEHFDETLRRTVPESP